MCFVGMYTENMSVWKINKLFIFPDSCLYARLYAETIKGFFIGLLIRPTIMRNQITIEDAHISF